MKLKELNRLADNVAVTSGYRVGTFYVRLLDGLEKIKTGQNGRGRFHSWGLFRGAHMVHSTCTKDEMGAYLSGWVQGRDVTIDRMFSNKG